jgi:hypothetical protein
MPIQEQLQEPSKAARPWNRLHLWGEPVHLWPLLVGLLIVLFPFDWLSEAWPAFGRLFDMVFVNARDHAIGHATMFLLISLVILFAVPALRSSPARYFGLLLLVGVAQEALQDLSKQVPPNIYEFRDLFFDLVGAAAAYLVVFAWHRLALRKQTPA